MKSFKKLGIHFVRDLIENKEQRTRNFHTASAFSEWVFDLDKGKLESRVSKESSLNRGKELHSRLTASARDTFSTDGFSHEMNNTDRKDLRTIYQDDGHAQSLVCSPLNFDEKLFKCRPDFVCEGIDSKTIFIFEHKSTWRSGSTLPRSLNDLWLNVVCQAWAYAQIDKFQSAPKIRIIIVFWENRYDNFLPVKRYIWDYKSNSTKSLEDKCSSIFDLYKRWVRHQTIA